MTQVSMMKCVTVKHVTWNIFSPQCVDRSVTTIPKSSLVRHQRRSLAICPQCLMLMLDVICRLTTSCLLWAKVLHTRSLMTVLSLFFDGAMSWFGSSFCCSLLPPAGQCVKQRFSFPHFLYILPQQTSHLGACSFWGRVCSNTCSQIIFQDFRWTWQLVSTFPSLTTFSLASLSTASVAIEKSGMMILFGHDVVWGFAHGDKITMSCEHTEFVAVSAVELELYFHSLHLSGFRAVNIRTPDGIITTLISPWCLISMVEWRVK